MEANSILAYENNGVKYTFNNINSIIKGGILPATLYNSIDSSLIVDGFPPQDYSKDDSNPRACPIYDKQTRKFYLRVLGGDKDNRLYYTKWRAGGYYDMHVDYPSSDYYYQYTSHICIDLDDYTPYFVGEALSPDEIVTKITIPRYIYNKVDKETGKGLSTNDYTTAEKTKLAGIATGAEVNVQSDWNAASGDAFIKNKPTIPASPTWVDIRRNSIYRKEDVAYDDRLINKQYSVIRLGEEPILGDCTLIANWNIGAADIEEQGDYYVFSGNCAPEAVVELHTAPGSNTRISIVDRQGNYFKWMTPALGVLDADSCYLITLMDGTAGIVKLEERQWA